MNKRVFITLNDLKEIRPLAELDGQRWEQYAVEAQDQELRPILGDGLFYDFMTKFYSTGDAMYAAYQELINGKAYTYNGQTIYFDGLKPMMCYFTLARFVANNQVNITRFGVVRKTTPQSEPVDLNTITQQVNEFKACASTYATQVKQFLLQNQTTYAKYIGSEDTNTTGFKIFKG